MSSFRLQLQDTARSEQITDVISFVGEDTSGSFGILAGHARFMTTLVVGLARFRTADNQWHYLAMPGAVLYFCDNTLTLSTRHYLRDNDYQRISAALQEQLLTEEENLQATKRTLHRMEEEILKRMWEMGRRGG